jgi:hypothetical protein
MKRGAIQQTIQESPRNSFKTPLAWH